MRLYITFCRFWPGDFTVGLCFSLRDKFQVIVRIAALGLTSFLSNTYTLRWEFAENAFKTVF